ncbi:MAG: M16 family metallopeptidase [bacterium]
MYEYHTLPNGIKIILSHTPSRVTYSGVYINVGSRDESGTDEGMAHFIEHSLFKGTEHRRAYHIQNRIDGVGGELNAFTTKEETCVYASSLSEHLERCLELFADILFHSTFPLNEIEKEKDVVLEEINSYNDTPSELIYDQYEELAYAGHPLAHNILGTKRNVKRFTPKSIQHFMRTNYTPSRMVVTVSGNVEFSRLVRLCEKYFGGYSNHPSAVDRSHKPVFQPFERHVNRHTHQAHLLIGCEAPDVYHADKTAFSLLNNILGGPAMNSRLNVAVREHYGFCYNIESQYIPFSDTGLFYIYAGVDSGAQEKARRLIVNELLRIATTPLTDTQLRSAQRQMIGQIAINDDFGMNEMQSIGKAYLCYDHVNTLEEMNADLLAVTPADLQRVAQERFNPDRFGLLVYGN